MLRKIFKPVSLICLALISIEINALELEIDDIEIPAICENIQDFVMPVDLSPACLAAQTAAVSYPPLLPAANQLCQTLEGTTATLGVAQIKINQIYEKCQLELAKIENELMKGVSGFEDLINNEFIKKKRLLNVLSNEELEEKALEQDVAYLSVEQWDEIIDQSADPKLKQSKRKLFKELAKSNYVTDQLLVKGIADDMINIIVQLLNKSSTNISVKESQDLNARMTAELVYQQQAFQQIMVQYMALLAAEQEMALAEEKYLKTFIGGIHE